MATCMSNFIKDTINAGVFELSPSDTITKKDVTASSGVCCFMFMAV